MKITHHSFLPGCRLLVPLLIAGAIVLLPSAARAQAMRQRIASIQCQQSNVIVTARVPAGARAVILESRPGFGSGSWQTRATVALHRAPSNVVFRLPLAQEMEWLRVRLDGVTNVPPRMVVFGDSLTDTGNHFDLEGTPAPPNYAGRYSDGPVWIEYLAARLGLAPNEWINYAVGSAASGREDAYGRIEKPGLLDELDLYLTEAGSLGAHETNALFVLWIGANDFARWFFTGAYTNLGPNELLDTALGNIRHVIETLAERGARRFLVPNLPDLGQIPLVQGYRDPAAAQAASLGTVGFNLNLAWMLGELEAKHSNTIDVVHYDVFSIYEAVRGNPSAFGFSNVVAGCWAGSTNEPCVMPSSHLFWDDLHPTTAAHQILGDGAFAALTTGGTPLPSGCPVLATGPAPVTLTTRHGQFTTAASIAITGMTGDDLPPGATLQVNGTPAVLAADGSFAATVSLNASNVAQPILAELRAGDQVLGRDRIVVYKGPSLRNGAVTPDAVVATLNSNGVSAVRDEITSEIYSAGVVNLDPFIPDILASDFGGTFQYAAVTLPSLYSCFTVDAQMSNGFVRLWFSLHDILVNYHFKAWLHGLPDPGFECDGGFYAGNFNAYLDVIVQPATGGAAGEVAVTPLSELRWDLVNFQHVVYNCDLDEIIGAFGFDLRAWFRSQVGNVEGYIRNALNEYLRPGTGQMLATQLQRLFGRLRLSQPLSQALGVTVTGDIQQVAHLPGRLDVRFRAGLAGSNTISAETYAPPAGPIQHTGVDPIASRPYDFAVSVSFKTLNQLLLAEAGRISPDGEATQLPLGGRNLPLTAGLLSVFFPALRAEPPATPYKLVVRPTLPPMIVRGPSEACAGVDVAMDQVRLEVVRLGGGGETVALAVALDLRGCVNFGYNRSHSSLTVQLALPPECLGNVVILENRICASEAVISRLLDVALPPFIAAFGRDVFEFPLPSLRGLEITPTRIVPQDGYVSVFVNLTPEFGRPDLIVAEIDAPEVVDVTFPFTFRVRVKNTGHAPALGGTWIGASFSRDGVFFNGNDGGVGLRFFNFRGGALGIGESEWFTFGADSASWAADALQTMFVQVDAPQFFGSSGLYCESSELNNLGHVPIRTTRADAFVVSIDPPDGLVGGGPPGAYRVTVGRSDVGIDSMWVPVRVAIGDPVVTWQDVIFNNVPRGGTETMTVFVPTPASSGPPCVGASNNFTVTACANMMIDANRNNDCRRTSVSIAVPSWDLRFEILNAPSTGRQCGSVDWDIRVTNVGSVSSDNVCFFSGIGAHAGAGNWGENLRQIPFWSGNIPPGESRVFNVRNYGIGCGAYARTQYIKTEINYTAGCSDLCVRENYDEQPIEIQRTFWDLRFEIINEPSIGYHCGSARWDVRITNLGNTTSDDVCFISGICADPGAGNWGRCLSTIPGSSGRIPPGGSVTRPIRNYPVWCNALLGTQYIKAEIHYSNHCFDDNTAGNFDQEPITIR